jgi:hypothetical protein
MSVSGTVPQIQELMPQLAAELEAAMARYELRP